MNLKLEFLTSTILSDKSAICTNRFKSQNFPFEYIAVDDLHFYRRRKPCNCNKSVVSFFTLCFDRQHRSSADTNWSFLSADLFESNISLCSKAESSSTYRTEYKQNFYEKALFGKLAPINRPPNLSVDACENEIT